MFLLSLILKHNIVVPNLITLLTCTALAGRAAVAVVWSVPSTMLALPTAAILTPEKSCDS